MTSLNNGTLATTYTYRADGMRVLKSNTTGLTIIRHDGQMGMQDVDLNGSGVWQKTTDYALGARVIEAISTTTSGGTDLAYPLDDE